MAWMTTDRSQIPAGPVARQAAAAQQGDMPAELSSSVATQLLTSSTFFAQSAANAYSSESWQVFYLHLATAVEQLIKAVLAQAHPSFIADPRADFDSLLHLCGLGHMARTPDFVAVVRTITVSEALQRIGRVVDDYRPPGPRVRLLLDNRNSIIHVGHQSKVEAEAILGEVGNYVDALLPSIGLDGAGYWGDASEMVEDHARRRLSTIEATFHRRVQAAKERYRQRTLLMDDMGLAAYLAAVAPATPAEPYDAVPAPCPACGNVGELTGTPDPTWEPDWDVADGEGYVAGVYVGAIQLNASGFACRACGLSLDVSLLSLADLDMVTLTQDEFDVSDASLFFERQFADDEWEGS